MVCTSPTCQSVPTPQQSHSKTPSQRCELLQDDGRLLALVLAVGEEDGLADGVRRALEDLARRAEARGHGRAARGLDLGD